MPVVMIVVASAAADFCGLTVQKRNNGMVGDPPALDAVVIDYVAQSILEHNRMEKLFEYNRTDVKGMAGGAPLL